MFGLRQGGIKDFECRDEIPLERDSPLAVRIAELNFGSSSRRKRVFRSWMTILATAGASLAKLRRCFGAGAALRVDPPPDKSFLATTRRFERLVLNRHGAALLAGDGGRIDSTIIPQ